MDISIIIPVYNVEKYLTECLDSVKRNIKEISAEVLLIDDGSTDTSPSILKNYAEKEIVFKYYRTENRGLSAARNYGVSLAKGKYLYFVDSDDILVDGILLKMFNMAERNKTELTICYVGKLKDNKVLTSDIHLRAFHNLKGNITHIKKYPQLVYDSTIWNKLILRSFYLENKISFPEGFMYEDIPTAVPLHCYASAVSVVRNTGYLWRIRSDNSKQITGQFTDKKNLTDKIAMMSRVFDFLHNEIKEPNIVKAFESKILNVDFTGYLNAFYRMDKTLVQEYIDVIAEFVNKYIHAESIARLPLKNQQIFKDILEDNREHLLKVINYKNINYSRAPFVEKDGKIHLLLPNDIFTIKSREIIREFAEQPPNCFVDFITISKTETAVVCLQGHLYYRRINITTDKQQRLSAYLFNEITGKTFQLEITPCESHFLTEKQGMILNYDDYMYYSYNYDWAGFKLIIDFEKLMEEDFKGENWIALRYENMYFSGERLLRGIAKDAKKVLEKYSFNTLQWTGKVIFDKQNTISVFISRVTNS